MVHGPMGNTPTLWLDYVDRQGLRAWREVVPLRVVLGPVSTLGEEPRYGLAVATPEGERTLLMTSIKGFRASDPEKAATLHVWEFQGAWHVVPNGGQVPLFTSATRDGAEDWIHGYTGAKVFEGNVHVEAA